MALADTSFLVALGNESDKFHDAAADHDLRGHRVLVPRDVWAEYCQVLLRQEPSVDIGAGLALADAAGFEVRSTIDKAQLDNLVMSARKINARILRESMRPLSLVDLILLHTAARLREEILTFDEGIRWAVKAKVFPGARLHN